jgi:hypothetical protein
MTNNISEKVKESNSKIKVDFQKLLLKKLIIWKYRLEKKLDRIKIVKIENFTPKRLSDLEDNHTALLYEVILDKTILNIALTGPYGSGKSSIIKTFEYKFGNLKTLNITLATFDGKIIKEDKTSKLEYNILKQIFYKVSHNKVPQSRFKRIVNHKYILPQTGLLFLWISSIIYLSSFNFPDSFLTTKLIHTLWLNKFYAELFDILCSLCAISGGIYFLYKTFDFFANFKIGKLKISEAELDNKNDSKTIDFENEIDEILYFFDRNKTDVVFIEDLDRFDSTEIYIKLREINLLINNYEPIKKKGKVTFVYAVRDNMFNETERTKFFDIILPVIPVVNYTNSSNKFLGSLAYNFNEIEDLEEKRKFKDFVELVSRYINDMRTIISICNEFKIYEKIIGGSGIDKIKLLAMMIYKNIEPSDFDCLDKNKGYVYQLFKNKETLIFKEIEKINKKIELIDVEKIEESKKESFENIIELRKLYLYTFINLVNKTKNQIVVKIKIGNEFFDEIELLKDNNFEKFSLQTNIQYVYNSSNENYYNSESSLSFKKIEDSVNKKLGYKKRFERIKNKERDELDKLRKESQDLIANRENLISKRLSEIFIIQKSIDYFDLTFYNYFTKPISTVQISESTNQSNIEFKCEYNHKINNKDLINFLVREGHIDENYDRFISKYNGSHKENQTFLLSLSNRKALDFNFEIKDISALIKNIKSDCFHQKEILNFYLMDYLMESKNKTQLDSIFIILKDESENSVSFIDRYLDFANDINKHKFLNRLIQHWKSIYSFILNETSYLPEKYITLIFKSLTINQINEVNIDNNLAHYISQMGDLNCIYFKDGNKSKVEEFLKNKNIRFENLNYSQEYKILIDFIYENNLYDLNFQMIELLVDLYKVNDIDLANLKTANFTTIQKSGCKKLIDYINREILLYVDCVFLELKDNIDEDENNIITLLNNEDLSKEICFLVIEKSPTIISDLLKIKDKTLWSKLFECNRLEISWKNFFEYYKDEKEIDETLVKYLNNETVFKTLSQIDMKEIDRNLKLSFSENIILSGIDHESFKDIAKQFPFCYSMDELIEANEIRIKVLIDNDLITFDKDNFESLNELYSSLTFLFIKKNKQEFLTIYPELELNNSILKDIIKSSEAEFNKEEKIKIIENIEDLILTSDKQLLKDLCIFLYDKYKININELVLNGLLSSDVEDVYKVTLFNIYYNKSLSTNILNMRIKSLGEPYDSILGLKHLKLINNSFNKLFCENLNGRYIGIPKVEKGMLKAIPKTIKR